MKRTFLLGLTMVVLAAPALTLADASIPVGQSPVQLLTTVAAVEAQGSAVQGNGSLACVALFSAPTVKVGQQVALAWGSVGAAAQTKDAENMWPLDGGFLMSFQKTGTWTYPFTFYSAGGQSVTCDAKITVTQ